MSRLLPKFTFANAIALLALFISLGGSVYAAGGFSGKEIRKGSIPANRLAPGSIGAEQVDESSLGQVPSAARADVAVRAERAERAESAGRAQEAQRADRADRALSAALTPAADHAAEAVTAVAAGDTQRLGGDPVTSFLPHACNGGAIKGTAKVSPRGAFPPSAEIDLGGSCAGVKPTVRVPRAGEYIVTFPRLTNGIPVVSPLEPGTEVSASRVPGSPPTDEYRVVVYSARPPTGLRALPFVIAIF
ncbi:MAG TPA: hypothetical protein VMS60_05085 [Solirubrobacterales bacterium]|nr:hypothetical protein [Solirubrobacterales bacterium]